jgi:hypothetical protein
MTTQLEALAKPVPNNWVHQKPGKFAADYIKHGDAVQIALSKLDVPPSQEITQLIRGAEGHIVGVVLRMVLQIDGNTVVIDEVGETERPGAVDSVKSCVSDAYKRCLMRCGVALSLYCEQYVLDKLLAEKNSNNG